MWKFLNMRIRRNEVMKFSTVILILIILRSVIIIMDLAKGSYNSFLIDILYIIGMGGLYLYYRKKNS